MIYSEREDKGHRLSLALFVSEVRTDTRLVSSTERATARKVIEGMALPEERRARLLEALTVGE